MPTPDRDDQAVLLGRLTLALLAVGVLWRAWRYLLCFPLWGDEAMVCLNFLELDYAGLTRQLRYCQVAPLLFLWGERTALRVLGPSELALRLLPFLAGLGSLLLFWRLARAALNPLAVPLAVGFLAVAIWPVSMGTFAKPYSFDLFMAVLLMLPAVLWLRRPDQRKWLALLALAAPVAVFGSYPAVFVGGAASLALLPSAWRQGGKARLLFAAYNLALAGSFLAHYWVVGRGQLHTPANGMTTEAGMRAYWADGFPPPPGPALTKWLLEAHTGQMFAYPVGAAGGGSAATVLLFLAGAGHFWATRRRPLLVLCAAPFALGLVAAALHRYPYGASCRLSQHVAPAVCLAAGAGAAALLGRLRSAERRRRWVAGVCGLLVLVGAGGMVRDALKPYRDAETVWVNRTMRAFVEEARSGGPVVVLNRPDEVDSVVRWHLGLLGDRVGWEGRVDWGRAAAAGEVLYLRYWFHMPGGPGDVCPVPVRGPARVPAECEAWLRASGRPWALERAVGDTGVPPSWQDPVKHVDWFRWRLDEEGRSAASGALGVVDGALVQSPER
jgi:4-amino-4-deoxy-L-arabinose transferase-like glycosyltransferase